MSVNIKDNTAKLVLDTQRNSTLAIRFLLDEIHDQSTPKTPKKTGMLRSNVLKVVTGSHGFIRWGQEYASRLESKQFKNYTTAGTGSKYAQNAVKRVIANPSQAFRKARLI